MQCHFCDRPADLSVEKDGVIVGICQAHFREHIDALAEAEWLEHIDAPLPPDELE